MTVHEIPLERRTLHGHFSRELDPVLTIDPGDTIAFATLNAGWENELDLGFEPRDAELDAGHALIGPVEVRGARAGGTLVVHVRSVAPAPWGVTFGRDTRIVWRLEGDAWVDDRGARVASAPFLGVLGMPPVGAGAHSTGPPRTSGGNKKPCSRPP